MMTVLAKNEEMTNRQRITAVLEGHEVDRFPVWLKMANKTWKSSQPADIQCLNDIDLLQNAGCDVMVARGVGQNVESPHTNSTRNKQADTYVTTVTTPDGTLTAEDKIDPYCQTTHPSKFMVENKKQLEMLRWLYTDNIHSVDIEAADTAAKIQKDLVAQDIFTFSGIGPSPLMHMIEHIAGPINTIYLQNDEPDLFTEIIELMHQDRVKLLETLLPHLPSDTFWLSENTSTTLISPDLFKKFCMPHLTDYGNLIKDHGIYPVHHMCGTLNALLEDIDELPAVANEAFTTRQLGDVSLADGRTRMPSKALIGGTNATLWLEDVETIVNTVAEDLADCPDRKKIFLTSAGVLPPPVSLEKAKKVVAALKEL